MTTTGLSFHIQSVSEPKFRTQHNGVELSEPLALLKPIFPQTVITREQIGKLEDLEAVWTAVYPGVGRFNIARPTFTPHGDLMAELVLEGHVAPVKKASASLKSRHWASVAASRTRIAATPVHSIGKSWNPTES